MSADYWSSTQRLHWTFSKSALAAVRRKLEDEDRSLVQQYPLPERRLLSIYFSHQIAKLGKRLQARQQILATAQVYVKRFYTKVEIRRTNPNIVLATALYLACKMEESPHHIRVFLGEIRHAWPDVAPISDTSKLGECEFTLISELNSQLIIHHPYRSLADLHSQFVLTQEEMSLAWLIINDHYLTDLPLLYPPHVIAVTAMMLAVVLKPTQSTPQLHGAGIQNALQSFNQLQAGPGSGPQNRLQKLVNWLAESTVDMDAVVDCTQELISLYEVWEQYNEKVCKEQIGRLVKARGLDK